MKKQFGYIKRSKREPILDKILKCKARWIQHIDRIQRRTFQIKKLQITWIKKPRLTFMETFG
jgi:hypothetical protein